jgi:hypothetical protein
MITAENDIFGHIGFLTLDAFMESQDIKSAALVHMSIQI